MYKLMQGLKDFIMRGNVVDLAVGIVIGAAFATLVGSFTSAFISPLLKVIGGGGARGGSFTVRGVVFPYTDFINGLIAFVITAAVIYLFVVTPMNMLAERRKQGVESEPDAPSDEVRLLTEIRDALRTGDVPAPRTSASSGGETSA
jgi:large conductance mechanosensitive channel